MMLLLKALNSFIIKKKQSFKLINFQVLWRSINSNNFTSVGRIFPLECVTVGFRSYGELNIYSYSNGINEKLTIGDYVSIANNVSFILGGNHNINTLTTYPLKNFVLNTPFQDSFSRGEIVVGNEAWIGFGATILSGVTIGKGAIIAAGSLVVRNVPPYAIVGGNPAKVIRFRFDKEIIDELLNMELVDFEDNFIIKNIEGFYSDIKSKNDVVYLVNKTKK